MKAVPSLFFMPYFFQETPVAEAGQQGQGFGIEYQGQSFQALSQVSQVGKVTPAQEVVQAILGIKFDSAVQCQVNICQAEPALPHPFQGVLADGNVGGHISSCFYNQGKYGKKITDSEIYQP